MACRRCPSVASRPCGRKRNTDDRGSAGRWPASMAPSAPTGCRPAAGTTRRHRMQGQPEYSGGCQCGAIRFQVRGALTDSSICHCRMCQKAFGAYYAPLVSVRGVQFSWTRGQPRYFQSSNVVRRGFCADCGTPLSYEAPDGVAAPLTNPSACRRRSSTGSSASCRSSIRWPTCRPVVPRKTSRRWSSWPPSCPISTRTTTRRTGRRAAGNAPVAPSAGSARQGPRRSARPADALP